MDMPYTKTNGQGVQVEDTRIVVVMVGLPARGKSLIAQKGTSFPQTMILAQAEADSGHLNQSSGTWDGSPYARRPSMSALTADRIPHGLLPTSSIRPIKKESVCDTLPLKPR